MMLSNIKVFRFSLFSVLVGGLISCSSSSYLGIAVPIGTSVTKISELAQQNGGSTVYLQGKVGVHAPFLSSGAYQLQDSTGLVWVLTNQSFPKQGDEVRIKGQVAYQSIPIGTQDVGELYIVELEKLEPQNQVQPPVEPTQPVQPTKPSKPETDDLFLPHKQFK